VTPAQPASLVDVLRRLYDPYGMAFGPRRPWYGYRPGPFGTPAQPWPPAFAPGWGPAGWGSAGWNWGAGAAQQPGARPAPPGDRSYRPLPPAHGLINPVPPPNRTVRL
jgi:hypothetical protein